MEGEKGYTFSFLLFKNISMNINLENKYNILLSDSNIDSVSLKDIFSKSSKTVLFFYPKDNTPGCTIENKDFSCLKDEFLKLWVQLIWVSKDSIESHKKFVEKQELNIDLISDSDLELHKELWAYGEKNNYWKIVMWVIRSTFIFDKNWNLLNEYRNIRAKWHAERILKEIKD